MYLIPCPHCGPRAQVEFTYERTMDAVVDPATPAPRPSGIVRRQAERHRVQVGGLNHDEAVTRPEVDERPVGVHGETEPMGEQHDRQVTARHKPVLKTGLSLSTFGAARWPGRAWR